ncbi:hypothetical protein, partial [Collinsella tanakaei]|uniref:hypothetical protein n=1 Tax=Collinsella tanakaei TaxID=626935 RepID=UPI00265A6B26
ASYQTAPPRNVWTHRVRKKVYYAGFSSKAREILRELKPVSGLYISFIYPLICLNVSGFILFSNHIASRHAIIDNVARK